LRLALRLRTAWEAALRCQCRPAWPLAARLHAGTASITNAGGPIPEQGEWYETMKRALIHGQQADAPERSLRRLAFGRIVNEELLDPVYQPIVSLAGEEVFGYEALSRLRDQEWFAGPLQLFKFAEEEGTFYTLDRLARRMAIAGCGLGRSGQKLFINMSAHIMEDP